MTQSAPGPGQTKVTEIEAILNGAAKEAGLEDINDVPAVASVWMRTDRGLVEWARFKPIPGDERMKILAMFQGDDMVRIYAWPTVVEHEGRRLFPSRYTLRSQGSIALVKEEMTGPVAIEELEKELFILMGVDPDDPDEPEDPETPETPAANGFTAPSAPAVPTPASF